MKVKRETVKAALTPKRTRKVKEGVPDAIVAANADALGEALAHPTGTALVNPREEAFCQLYSSQGEFFANGTQSVIEAFDLDLTKQGAYNAARQRGYALLTKPHILARINELVELSGLNDEFVDKQLLFVITQNADMNSKTQAIKEYNSLKARITKKLDMTSGGEPFAVNVVSYKEGTGE